MSQPGFSTGLIQHLERVSLYRRASSGSACTRRVVFIWAIRDKGDISYISNDEPHLTKTLCAAHLKWISGRFATLAASAPPGLTLTIQIYVTSSTPSLEELEKNPSIESGRDSSPDSDDKKSEIRSLAEADDSITMFEGRPDILNLLETEVKSSEGPVSVDGAFLSFIVLRTDVLKFDSRL